MFPLVLALLMAPPSQAGRCSDTAKARIEAARELLARVPDTSPEDQASVVERARILLEKVVAEEPRCKEAWVVKAEADGQILTVTPVSEQANFELALAEARTRTEDLEAEEQPDPSELEDLKFLLAELHRLAPEDQRVAELQERVAALGRGRR